MYRRTESRHHAGFTLFEMLIAVALFALMAVLAYGGLDRVIAARTAVEEDAARWRDLEALFARLQGDLGAVVQRSVLNEFGTTEPGFQGAQVLVGQDAAHLWLVRSSADGPPRRVGYRFKDGNLELLQWAVLDQPPRARPTVTRLWKGLKNFKVQYLSGSSWVPVWPTSTQAQATNDLPRALEVSVTLEDGIEVKRVLLLP